MANVPFAFSFTLVNGRVFYYYYDDYYYSKVMNGHM